jgi:hypothetical protein
MSKHKVTVTVFGVKVPPADQIGLLTIEIPVPPSHLFSKKRRRAYCDGVADGVSALMRELQPEGDGFS